ncbi:DUF6891 domain-containing protein [Pyxidicoccus trucidator]|uniref:DUF6891 domain-containing protein n=1 Tax=Pyxidicoccus trucidator TaxID=2709662 RepID=UPI0019676B5E|nr:hypothetical protein [Pyxidicoccus trucidator]
MRAYLREKAEAVVLGGYLSEKQAHSSIQELARHELGSDDAVEQLLAYARSLLERQKADELCWTGPTVNDAITRAFEELNGKGIVAMEDAGGSLSDGWAEVTRAARDSAPPARGAPFFHGQDVERGVFGAGLMLAFGAFDEYFQLDDAASPAIAREVREALARHGVRTEWNGNIQQRIHIPPFPWRKRHSTQPGRKGRSRGRQKEEPLPERFSCKEVLEEVTREERVTHEDAIAALEAHIRDAALKHYGDWRKLEARYDPEKDRVEVFQDISARPRRGSCAGWCTTPGGLMRGRTPRVAPAGIEPAAHPRAAEASESAGGRPRRPRRAPGSRTMPSASRSFRNRAPR